MNAVPPGVEGGRPKIGVIICDERETLAEAESLKTRGSDTDWSINRSHAYTLWRLPRAKVAIRHANKPQPQGTEVTFPSPEREIRCHRARPFCSPEAV